MRHSRIVLFLTGLVLVIGVVTALLMGGPQAQVQMQDASDRLRVRHTEISYFDKGAKVYFEAPLYTQEVVDYELRYSFVELGTEDADARWNELLGADEAYVSVAEAAFREGHLEKLLFFPPQPGNYWVAVKSKYRDGSLSNTMLVAQVYIPQMAYHSVATTLPREGLLPGVEHITLEKEGSSRYLTFAAPYSSIVSYDVRYAKEKLSSNDFRTFWNTAFCREDNRCVYLEDVKMQEGHKERIYIKDLPKPGETYTYGITFTLKSGETSTVSLPVYVEGEAPKQFDETFLEFVGSAKLYEALEHVGVIYDRKTVKLSWETPRQQVEYYVIRYAQEQLTKEEMQNKWDVLSCYEGSNCLYYPSEAKAIEELPLTMLPQGAKTYTYAVRYKVRGEEGLSKINDPVYVVDKKVQTIEELAAARAQSGTVPVTTVKSTMPAIKDLRVEEGTDSFYLVFTKPQETVYAYQLHYVAGAVTPATLQDTPMACSFVQHPTIRTSDSCSPYYTIIKDGSGDDGEVRLQLRNLQFPGITTFMVSYYDDKYHEAPSSNFVTVERPIIMPTVADETIKKVVGYRLFPEQEAVVYNALNEGILEADLSQFDPTQEVNRVLFARYLLLSRSGKVDMLKTSYWSVFCDVPRDQWYAPYAFMLYQLGIVGGYEDGACVTKKNFVPTNPVPLVEGLKIIFSFYGVSPSALAPDVTLPADVPVDHWAAPLVSYAIREGILSPDKDNKIYPNKPLSTLKALEYILATRSLVISALQK